MFIRVTVPAVRENLKFPSTRLGRLWDSQSHNLIFWLTNVLPKSEEGLGWSSGLLKYINTWECRREQS